MRSSSNSSAAEWAIFVTAVSSWRCAIMVSHEVKRTARPGDGRSRLREEWRKGACASLPRLRLKWFSRACVNWGDRNRSLEMGSISTANDDHNRLDDHSNHFLRLASSRHTPCAVAKIFPIEQSLRRGTAHACDGT